jgi:hypothetical protein
VNVVTSKCCDSSTYSVPVIEFGFLSEAVLSPLAFEDDGLLSPLAFEELDGLLSLMAFGALEGLLSLQAAMRNADATAVSKVYFMIFSFFS